MTLCSDGHKEICYEERDCPLCIQIGITEEAEKLYDKLDQLNDELYAKIDLLNDKIYNLEHKESEE